jgi:hypothetical protein
MKFLNVFIVLVIISQPLFGQNTYIAGKINNSQSDTVEIILQSIIENPRTIKARIKDGSFSVRFNISQPIPALLKQEKGYWRCLYFQMIA